MQPALKEAPKSPSSPDGFLIGTQVRRSLIQAARNFAVLQDQRDSAEWAMMAGDRAAARALYDLSFLRSGFAPPQRHEQEAIAGRLGLWQQEGLSRRSEPDRASPATGLAGAVAELRWLMAHSGSLGARETDALTGNPGQADPVYRPATDELIDACRSIVDELSRPSGEPDDDRLARALTSLLPLALAPDSPHLSEHVGDPGALLSAYFKANLSDFFRSNYELCYGPLGSAQTLRGAARFEPGALGAYLGNVGNLVRSGRDIFGLIQLAFPPSGQDASVPSSILEKGSVLLSLHLPERLLLDLVDELADLALLPPLKALLDREARSPASRTDRAVLWRIRDAALDLGDGPLAVRAQAMITARAGNDPTELQILGAIRGTFGDRAGAEEAFAEVLRSRPKDEGTTIRIEALRRDVFKPFLIMAGFGTPPYRHRLRRRRRQSELQNA